MPQRTSPNQIRSAEDLNGLDHLVQDKRYGKRAKAKKNRRNRHYEKQLLQNAIHHGVVHPNSQGELEP